MMLNGIFWKYPIKYPIYISVHQKRIRIRITLKKRKKKKEKKRIRITLFDIGFEI